MEKTNNGQTYLSREFNEDVAFLRQIADTCPAIIYVLDLERREFIYVNSSIKDLVGVDEMYVFMRGETIFMDVVHPEDYERRMQHINSLSHLKDTEIREIDVRIKVKDKGYQWFRISDRIFKRNEKGEPIQSIGIAYDIHDVKMAIANLDRQLQNKNRQMESLNAELKAFNTIATNDYSETLRNLYTSLEYIVSHDSNNLSHTGRANIRRSQSAIQKMKLLTEDVISYTKLHEIDTCKQVVDLNVILGNVLRDLERKSGQHNATINHDRLPYVAGYPFLTSLVFHHLIDNAIKFSKETTPAVIKISVKEFVMGDQVNHEASQPGIKYHIISVTDNGMGFSQQDAKRIFEIFSHLHNHNKFKGSGMGLAVCKKIMELHGGFITAESEPGRGATFHCFFPAEKINA